MPDFSWLEGQLTPHAMRVLQVATENSEQRQQFFLGVEHIFWGLLEVSPDVLKRLLAGSNLPLTELSSSLNQEMNLHYRRDWVEGIKVTPRAWRILKIAVDEAKREGKKQLDPRHLLRAVLQEGQSVPVRILEKKGLSTETLLLNLRGAEQAKADVLVLPAALRNWCYDLTTLAEDGKLPPVLGRESEIRRLIEILLVPEGPSNPLLTGFAGVGKTAIVEGLAQKLAVNTEDVPGRLQQCRIISLSMNSISSGTMFRGSLEARMKQVIDFFTQHRDRAILFIDEIHTVVRAGVVDALLAPLARGEIRLIGATTTPLYNRLIREDEALNRRFTQVDVEEPPLETVEKILYSLKERYVEQCDIRISDEAIAKAIELSPRYVMSQKLPHKAKHWLTLAVPKAELDTRNEVNAEDVMRVISEQAKIPVEMIQRTPKRLERMQEVLKQRVIGQDSALAALHQWMTGRLGPVPQRNPTAPNGVFLFLGPTGVGKTETAKALAEFLFGKESRMIRFDMSEYQDNLAYIRLIGHGRGIVGSEQGGLLTEKIKKTPYTVLLLDEIEKAHPNVLRLFLQAFDEGWMTDGLGNTVYFSDVTMIMTSNLGSHLFKPERPIGFPGEETERDLIKLREEVIQFAKARMSPELFNRLDDVRVFDPLSPESIKEIASLLFEKLKERIAPDGKKLVIEAAAIELVAKVGYDPIYGARELERAFLRLVENRLNGCYSEASQFTVKVVAEDIVVEPVKAVVEKCEEDGRIHV